MGTNWRNLSKLENHPLVCSASILHSTHTLHSVFKVALEHSITFTAERRFEGGQKHRRNSSLQMPQ
jgi:hypothetical protein